MYFYQHCNDLNKLFFEKYFLSQSICHCNQVHTYIHTYIHPYIHPSIHTQLTNQSPIHTAKKTNQPTTQPMTVYQPFRSQMCCESHICCSRCFWLLCCSCSHASISVFFSLPPFHLEMSVYGNRRQTKK